MQICSFFNNTDFRRKSTICQIQYVFTLIIKVIYFIFLFICNNIGIIFDAFEKINKNSKNPILFMENNNFVLFLFCVAFGVAFCMNFNAKAQKLDIAFSAGTGKAYIFESIDRSVNVNYGTPLSFLAETKFTPKNASWGIKLRFQSIETTIKGENWTEFFAPQINGYISSQTTSLLLEKEINKFAGTFGDKFSCGLNFGLGLTTETMQKQQTNPAEKTSKNYLSTTFGAHFTYKLNDNFDLQLLPTMLWQDPFKTISFLSGNTRPNLAGEDLSMILNVGVRYKIFK